ncbi:uncharacterized protein [Palaemon carinicauda]|uniref:uncharacterized protein n=1 Tax=Palaemon carinicauda TaxID=392227 RepID=UPI0035B5CACC
MSHKLKYHISSRGNFRGQVNIIFNDISSLSGKSEDERKILEIKLNRVKDELSRLDVIIRDLKWEDNASDEAKAVAENEREITESSSYDDKINRCLYNLTKVSVSQSPCCNSGRLKSPEAPLPTFCSQDGEDLTKFLSQFEDVVQRYNYSDFDKFLLLKQQISGRASHLINSLDSVQQSYTIAKDLLLQALASPSVRKFNVLQRLTELKLDFSSDPFEYIGNINSIQDSIKSLSISVDDVVQYFSWKGLNKKFQDQLVQITNETNPSLDQIKIKFFEASERYMEVQKRVDYRSKHRPCPSNSAVGLAAKVDCQSTPTTSLASNVKLRKDNANVFKHCSLCDNGDHPVHKCSKYPDPKSKLDRLKKLKACIKCARLDHSSDKCNFYFARRCFCGSFHFTFLCLSNIRKEHTNDSNGLAKKGKDKPPKSDKVEVKDKSSSITFAEASRDVMMVNDCSLAILPTFSCDLLNGNRIRCLRDGGCQSNFITEVCAVRENLPIVKSNITLRVNGFNSSRLYNTCSYKVSMMIGDRLCELEAMSVPSIKTCLKLPGLTSVVQGFIEKGYTVADKYLLNGKDEIMDVDFILGSNSAYCLKENTVLFGDLEGNIPSVYSVTPLGIMLIGNLDQMSHNLIHLKNCQDTVAHISCSNILSIVCEEVEDMGNVCNASLTNSYTEVGANFAVLDHNGEIIDTEFERASKEVLENLCLKTLNFDDVNIPEDYVENNDKIVDYVLSNTTRNADGRLVMPLIWNNKVKHLLGKNRHLATQILKSNLKKFTIKNPDYLNMMDQYFKEQQELGIIERIENLEQFLLENPCHSFMGHLGVFKLERETTKCRVVFLSNLSERDPSQKVTLSHNQAMLSGPCINQKITTALLNLRFDTKLLCFDVKKAFLNICLTPLDSNKLLFLWFKNMARKDYTLVGYRNLRLPFGLVCSPCLLLLGLYKILMIDTDMDSKEIKELKRHIYSLIYMDNGSITSNTAEELQWAFDNLKNIFEPYKFFLQQFVTNDKELQDKIDENESKKTSTEVKLLGMVWNRLDDTLRTRHLQLDIGADNKRKVLKSIAAHYDVFGFTGPILNRARLFLHKLQCDGSFDWDMKLDDSLLREWKNICRQVNASPEIKIQRFMGRRNSQYRLVAFTDSSKDIYGTTVYIQEIDSLEVSFVLAKNRIVNKALSAKGIPSLEFQSIVLGSEVLIDLYKDLVGPACVSPLDIVELKLYSDSLVSLAWINSHVHKLEKQSKKSIFILNRLEHISRLCEIHPLIYGFVSGIENPADQITRPVSYRTLIKSNYFSGPKFLKVCSNMDMQISRDDILNIQVPNPLAKPDLSALEARNYQVMHGTSIAKVNEHLISPQKYSDFYKLVSVLRLVLKFVHILKGRLYKRDTVKYAHMKVTSTNLYTEAITQILKVDQDIHFADVKKYFSSKFKNVGNIPNLVNQLNVYPDRTGLLRVRSKFSRWKCDESIRYPILLSKHSELVRLIILSLHCALSHSGCYVILTELRKQYWVPHYFSVVKRVLKECITCRKVKQRTIKLNQSPYREFRLEPPNIPFKYIFIDHLGYFQVKYQQKKIKVWILCITCLWSRAINLKICFDLSTVEFLRAFQIHTYEYGIPELCLSDLGSSLVAGANIMTDFLRDSDTQAYFEENNRF